MALAEQMRSFGFHPGEIVGMDAAPPEIRAVEILAGLVAQDFADVVADEGRAEIARGRKL